ncbi:hypothetical protein AYK24_00520 [Thermoplasmatales archaeon SG8-52-4]|nr:MAG: hypothetical protein AYK24_00520 [Thermoplasmatales archaeon SG8-52-4]
MTSLENVYNHLVDDMIKYKKAPIDPIKLKQTLASAKKEMLKIIEDVGKKLDEQRTLTETS